MDVAQTARHEDLQIRFQKPAGWEFLENDEWSVIFELAETPPNQYPSTDQELPAITLVVRGSFEKSLSDFSKLAIDGIQASYPNSKQISQRDRELLHFPAAQTILSLNPSEEKEEMLTSILCAVNDQIGYMLFYSAKESEFFEKMEAMEEIVRSLEFEQKNGLDTLIRHQILAQEYTQSGKWEQAIEELEKGWQLKPDNRQIQRKLSYLYAVAGNEAFVKKGDLGKARHLLEWALALNDNQPEVKKLLNVIQSIHETSPEKSLL